MGLRLLDWAWHGSARPSPKLREAHWLAAVQPPALDQQASYRRGGEGARLDGLEEGPSPLSVPTQQGRAGSFAGGAEQNGNGHVAMKGSQHGRFNLGQYF